MFTIYRKKLSCALFSYLFLGIGTPLYAQSSQPATGATTQPEALYSQLILILELDENHMKVQENWQIQNPTSGSVPSGELVFQLGQTKRLTLDENAKGFEASPDGREVRSDGPLSPGQHSFAATYLTPLESGTLSFNRTFPTRLHSGRIIVEDIEGLDVVGSVPFTRRTRDLNGISFLIFDFNNIPQGQALEFRVSGLPSRSELPRTIAFILCGLAVVWTLYSVFLSGTPVTPQTMGALSAEARKEQLIRALELLEDDRSSGKIEGKKHERRHQKLMNELAAVLRELDLSKNMSSSSSPKTS